jgi:hypothetical protein
VILLSGCGGSSRSNDPAGDGGSGAVENGGSSGGGAPGGGGVSGSGAAAGAGAVSGSAGDCGLGTAQFHVELAEGLEPASLCVDGCALDVRFSTSAGVPLQIGPNCNVASCGTCQPSGCPTIYCQPYLLEAAMFDLSWDGRHWQYDTCGEGVGCQQPTCVEAGRYSVSVCIPHALGASESSCDPDPEHSACGTAEFDLPSQQTTMLTLGP